MSCHVLDFESIAFLVLAAARGGLSADPLGGYFYSPNGTKDYSCVPGLDDEKIVAMGQELLRVNEESVARRYDEAEGDSHLVFSKEDIRSQWTTYDPITVYKICLQYEYKAREAPDYGNTDAARFVSALKEHAICTSAEYRRARTVPPTRSEVVSIFNL